MPTLTIEPKSPDLIPVDDRLHEIVNGEHQEKRRGALEVHVMSTLGILLGHFAMSNQIGKVEFEMLFELGLSDGSKLRPDVAFISFERWPKSRRVPSENAFSVVPDLVVEVISPSNSANEVEEKVMKYIEVGVKLVWVVHPITARVYIHDGSSTIRVVTRDEELNGGTVLPGFILSLVDLFELEARSS